MTRRHITMEYPAKQIQFQPLPLIYCRSILFFSFFFPSELQINNSAGNCSVLVANSLTSHFISLSLSLSPVPYVPYVSVLLLSASFVSMCARLVCMYISTYYLSACLSGKGFTCFCMFHLSFPPSILSFILPSSLLSLPLRSRAWWKSHDLNR